MVDRFQERAETPQPPRPRLNFDFFEGGDRFAPPSDRVPGRQQLTPEQLRERVAQHTVRIEANGQQQSGAIVNTGDGHLALLTTYHGLRQATQVGGRTFVQVVYNGRTYNSEVLAVNPATDTAVLSVPRELQGLPGLPLADSTRNRNGERVVGGGHPHGSTNVVVMDGATHGVRRAGHLPGAGPQQDVNRPVEGATMRVLVGASGGPAINQNGELVGIIEGGNGDNRGNQALITPIEQYRQLLGQTHDRLPIRDDLAIAPGTPRYEHQAAPRQTEFMMANAIMPEAGDNPFDPRTVMRYGFGRRPARPGEVRRPGHHHPTEAPPHPRTPELPLLTDPFDTRAASRLGLTRPPEVTDTDNPFEPTGTDLFDPLEGEQVRTGDPRLALSMNIRMMREFVERVRQWQQEHQLEFRNPFPPEFPFFPAA